MAKAVSEWDEAYVTGVLPLGEHDWLERKGTQLFDDENNLRNVLAKEVSAFANSGGGQIVCGVEDETGQVDKGGVPANLHNGTREWLGNVIPNLTAERVTEFSVYEIGRQDGCPGTTIDSGKAIFVIDVAHSDRRPHQCRHNCVYCQRVGGKCEPMPHALVVDMINRRANPHLEVVEIALVNPAFFPLESPLSYQFQIALSLRNAGRVIAVHWTMQLGVPSAMRTETSRHRLQSGWTVDSWRPVHWQEPGVDSFLYPHAGVLFPTQELRIVSGSLQINKGNYHAFQQREKVRWRVFADSSEPATGEIAPLDMQPVGEALNQLAHNWESK